MAITGNGLFGELEEPYRSQYLAVGAGIILLCLIVIAVIIFSVRRLLKLHKSGAKIWEGLVAGLVIALIVYSVGVLAWYSS